MQFNDIETLIKAVSDACEWEETQLGHKPQVALPRLQQQGYPQTRTLLLYCYQYRGKILHQRSTTEEWISSPLVAEGLQIWEALFQAHAYGFNKLKNQVGHSGYHPSHQWERPNQGIFWNALVHFQFNLLSL